MFIINETLYTNIDRCFPFICYSKLLAVTFAPTFSIVTGAKKDESNKYSKQITYEQYMAIKTLTYVPFLSLLCVLILGFYLYQYMTKKGSNKFASVIYLIALVYTGLVVVASVYMLNLDIKDINGKYEIRNMTETEKNMITLSSYVIIVIFVISLCFGGLISYR